MTAATLRALHHGRATGDPLVLPGPWDAASARVFAEAGFPALATPSAGVSAALGYEDGEAPAAEMFAAIARIVRAVPVPVTADVESGYGLPPKELVERLLETGAVGCNLEDSDHRTGRLKDPAEQADYLAAVRAEAGEALFINARVDTFLHGVADPGQALDRARRYTEAGADCLYPILAPAEQLAGFAAEVTLPVNALALPTGPSPRELGQLGATRVTFGGGQHHKSMTALADSARELREA
ncbi:isocitrate lyase/PEP mutase family protein [Streptomyces orinoci]|uniref:Isocitrate lyase/phosphoenolpyruvate mutase family protein n=1 Tax=Streptomyces orinoci TaxID=67339 RepID=A0ABV3JU65_STRON|nr:isocitrate lyase/phosphoenolpyruvate mutase family protein [Streptomyces orinoci]